MAVHTHDPTATMTISTEERAFFTALGERIAALRKANNVTQVQLAEAKADFIVTGDKPLLSVNEHQGVRLTGVGQALQIAHLS
jgi:hypothetical protein